MRKAGIILALFLFTLACDGQELTTFILNPTATPVPYPTAAPPQPSPTPSPEPTSYKVTIVLDPSLTGKDPAIAAAWVAYAGARAEWIDKNVAVNYIVDNAYHRSFNEELAGRTALAEVWKSEKKAEPRLQDIYLDQLLQIYQAHYLREYTWTYYADDTWEQPKGLYLKMFTDWMKANMKRVHIPQTLAGVEITLDK